MKYLFIILLFTTCATRELQVTHTMVTVMEVTPFERMGVEDRIWIHFKGGNGMNYYMVSDARDSNYFKVGRKFPYLVNR